MPKKTDTIYGSKLTRKDLEPLLPINKPIPFVYVYACAVKLDCTQDELFEKIKSIKDTIPDFKNCVNNNEGTPYDSLIVQFTRNQWTIDFRWKDEEVWVQISFGGHGKPWGSNYALWLRHQQWIFGELEAIHIRDLMDHVDPVDVKLPK